MNRKERRSNDAYVIAKREELASKGSSSPIMKITGGKEIGGGGWGVSGPQAKPATGQRPASNPFMTPKGAGLNVISQAFPNNYYVEWNIGSWRAACDQAIKMGYCTSIATLYSWCFESSPFVQSLFNKLGAAIDRIPFFMIDKNGDQLDDWTKEMCSKPWQLQIRREMLFSCFWGFTGLNFDPVEGKVYKYPMQNIDPINRMLKQSTYSFYDGVNFAETDNLLFVQPSTSYESFLGWMQPITRSFIQMNLNKNNWIAAGRKLAFPLLTIGYPQDDNSVDSLGNAYNPMRIQAEDIAANVDPSKGMVYPYTIGLDGKIQKSLEVEYEATGASNGAHKIYQEFNADEKADIQEMVFGGSLTSSTGKNGNRNLGEIQERMLENVVDSKLEFIIATMNTDFLPKLKKFYKNFPDGATYSVNRTKEMTIEEILAISQVMVVNGKKLTDEFFESNGISREFFEDAPAMVLPKQVEATESSSTDYEMAQPKRSLFGSLLKKKYL